MSDLKNMAVNKLKEAKELIDEFQCENNMYDSCKDSMNAYDLIIKIESRIDVVILLLGNTK